MVKLWHKELIGFIIISFLLTASVLYVLRDLKTKKRNETGASLQSVLKTTEQALNVWFDHRRGDINYLAQEAEVVLYSTELLQACHTPDSLVGHPTQKKIRDFLKKKIARYGDRGMFIISPAMINLSSMRDANIGVRNLLVETNPEKLKSLFDGQIIITPPVYSDVPLFTSNKVGRDMSMFIGAPIKNKEGQIIAGLMLRLDPQRALLAIAGSGKIGKSGETYAFNSSGLMISQSRFREQLVKVGLIDKQESELLEIRIVDPGTNLLDGNNPPKDYDNLPLTKMAQSALDEGSGQDVTGYRDYRGVPVMGAWLWNDQLGIGMATEINVQEAMASYYETRTTISTLGLLLLVVFASIIFYFRYSKIRDKENMEKLAKSNKMASLGMLSAGIAHELNSPFNFFNLGVQVIKNGLDQTMTLLALYESRTKSDPSFAEIRKFKSDIDYDQLKNDVKHTIEVMENGASRSLSIIQGLKNFSNADQGEKSLMDIHECLETAISLLAYKTKNRVVVVRNYSDNLEEILCFPGELNQAFVDILSHAEQAIMGKGVLTITSRAEKNNIVVLIEDSLAQMDEAHLQELIDGASTTDNSTDMPLSASKSIIDKHGGQISVFCKNERNCEIRIQLPKVA